ncbi:hypothetical protein [Fervidobacterium nodosum]|uniref:Uncharacterized protein n=1 Tax=Fervidobacterium nodosum (strain ATCC 35602 / DSM 5306 / Rt17-B1) TaxID=381764 RepID=A7HM13_FERNB|nr:hypothetical protein [Fervidobacterium nodosum]ABS60946.1 hypothetical protein Fnod_1098 [Fervidobacterium nodosum Rt17-B1]
MKSLKKFLTVFLILVGLVVMFAEGEHVHDEECGCEIADARDLAVDTSLQLPANLLDSEFYEKLMELEENLNLLYEITEGKVTYEEFDELVNTVMSLADQILSFEERTNSYIDLSIEVLREEFLTNLSDSFGELMKLIEDLKITVDIHDGDILKLYETLGSLSEEISLLSERTADYDDLKAQLEELSLKLDLHDQDIVNIYDVLAYKADLSLVEQLENKLNELTISLKSEINNGLDARIGLLEEYTNMIYEVANTKVSAEEVEEMISPLKDEVNDISKKLTEVVEKTRNQDVDIIKLYDAIAKLAEELRRIGGRLSTLESLVNELRNK